MMTAPARLLDTRVAGRSRRTLAVALCALLLLPTAAAATDGVDAAPSEVDAPGVAGQAQPLAETGPPTGLLVTSTLGRVHLWWTWPEVLPVREVTGWVVARREPGGVWSDVAVAEGQEHEDTTVVLGRRYEYRVRATGPDGDGAASPPVTVVAARHDLIARSHVTPSVEQAAVGYRIPGGNLTRATTSPDGRWTVGACMENTARVHLCRLPTVGAGAVTRLTDMEGHVESPAWSPDGTRIAFTLAVEGQLPSVWVVPAGGGVPTRLLDRADDPEWDRDGTLIVTDLSTAPSRLARVTPTGGRRAIAGTEGGRGPAVSPDGRYLAFTVPGTDTGPREDAQIDRALALLPLSGTATVPAVVRLTDGGYGRPTWRPDGRAVAANYRQRWRSGSTVRATFGVVALRLVTSGGARLEPTLHQQSSLGSPAYRAFGVHLTSTPTLTGPAPRIGFAVREPLPGTTFTCRLDGGAATPCTSPWRGSGLSTGPHHLIVEALEPAGERTVTSHRWQVDATPPSVAVTALPAVTLDSRVTVEYRATDSAGVASYDVRYRRARSDGTFEAWVRPETWQGTTRTTRSLSLARGYQYCVSVRARDSFGTTSAWSPDRCTSRPLDDRALTASTGWTRGTGSAYLDGTVSSSSRTGAELTRGTVSATRVYVVATRCPTCGKAEVFVGNTRVGRIDLHAPTTRHQQVIALPASSTVRSGKLTIRVTSSGAPVRIDAVAVRRT